MRSLEPEKLNTYRARMLLQALMDASIILHSLVYLYPLRRPNLKFGSSKPRANPVRTSKLWFCTNQGPLVCTGGNSPHQELPKYDFPREVRASDASFSSDQRGLSSPIVHRGVRPTCTRPPVRKFNPSIIFNDAPGRGLQR